MGRARSFRNISITCALFFAPAMAFSQIQTCPANINFSTGDLSSWAAQTGLMTGASQSYPAPNNGVISIPEFNIGNTGIQVITSTYADPYGNFPSIPTINGYSYNYSVVLGSESTSWDLHATSGNPGGFSRSVTYVINVPPGSTTVPYTMTYAYAMVLENGTHNSNEQPLFKATLQTIDSVISCASPKYFLPTLNNTGVGQTGATLDTAAAIANGFSLSTKLFLSHAGNNNNGGIYLQDVWTKDWTEVTFDLSPYRGKQVFLSFEADNCYPGAHFAYAYVALRNTCAGLQISGNPVACTNTSGTYSVPSLASAVYSWQVPPGWTVISGGNTNVIHVTAGVLGGLIIAHEVNSCADLRDTISVTTKPPTVPGSVQSDNTVCAGTNTSFLSLGGQTGKVLNWVFSADNGTTWTYLADTTTNYTAQDLTTTTLFSAVVQNGNTCSIDTSLAATITVNPKTVGGKITPHAKTFCLGQNQNNQLKLTGQTGSVVNWQISPDNINWTDFNPVLTDTVYTVNSVLATTYLRTVVKSGVCPADNSTPAVINFVNIPFPVANIFPSSAAICYGKTTPINATIATGTSYTWSNPGTLTNAGNGTVSSLPFNINAIATPKRTGDYILTVTNAGCPNNLLDTFHVDVSPRIVVFAGNDTSIVSNQPLQLHAVTNDSLANIFTWRPSFGLNDPNIFNPVAILSAEVGDVFTYIVRATDAAGCYGEDDIRITIFRTGPDIFVPSAFTPNGDGLNDILKPICVGIQYLDYFRIYNRWGQLVFETQEIGKGWDGYFKSKLQDTNTFVYTAEGVDYLGNRIRKKGSITLIR
jgi:gliding motility-associated-like protein